MADEERKENIVQIIENDTTDTSVDENRPAIVKENETTNNSEKYSTNKNVESDETADVKEENREDNVSEDRTKPEDATEQSTADEAEREMKRSPEEQRDGVTATNGEEERREETEQITETSETHKTSTTESSHIETSSETSVPAELISEKENDESEQVRNENEIQQDATESSTDPKKETVNAEAEEPPENNEKECDDQLKALEISEENIKSQLNDIIKEIDENVANEEKKENEIGEEQQQQDGEEEEVYHTWQPKGKYDIIATPVTRNDVIPIDVADVQEPAPLPPKAPAAEGDHAGQDAQQDDMEPIGPIIVPQLLPNGELGSPIEIPEGIPLLARVLPKDEDSHREKIPLERLFTPATDSGDITPKKKKSAFASSDFYAPNHPTIDDQLQLAQKISGSLADQHNNMSRGQAMYEKRKQRSVKWIHQEGGKMVQQEVEEDEEAHGSEIMDAPEPQPRAEGKPAMKLFMAPKGVQDHTTVDQHYQQLMEQQQHSSSSVTTTSHAAPTHMPASPEIVKDIMNDMQSPTGKGAALFAKRKKRMDKFIVDETNVQKSSAYQQEQQGFVNSSTQQSISSSSTQQSISSSSSSQKSISSSSAPVHQKPAAPGSKKQWLQERDKEQKQIMEDFLKNRESEVKLVKSPWESVLETGNTSSAFKKTEQSSKMFSSVSSSGSSSGGVSAPSWLEMPKPVPVAASQPAAPQAPLPTTPSPFAKAAAGPLPNAAAQPQQPQQPRQPQQPQQSRQPQQPQQPPVTRPVLQEAGFASQAEMDERRKSFNQAATGYGTYNHYYRPISFAS